VISSTLQSTPVFAQTLVLARGGAGQARETSQKQVLLGTQTDQIIFSLSKAALDNTAPKHGGMQYLMISSRFQLNNGLQLPLIASRELGAKRQEKEKRPQLLPPSYFAFSPHPQSPRQIISLFAPSYRI
jgi:hypothetical protein